MLPVLYVEKIVQTLSPMVIMQSSQGRAWSRVVQQHSIVGDAIQTQSRTCEAVTGSSGELLSWKHEVMQVHHAAMTFSNFRSGRNSESRVPRAVVNFPATSTNSMSGTYSPCEHCARCSRRAKMHRSQVSDRNPTERDRCMLGRDEPFRGRWAQRMCLRLVARVQRPAARSRAAGTNKIVAEIWRHSDEPWLHHTWVSVRDSEPDDPVAVLVPADVQPVLPTEPRSMTVCGETCPPLIIFKIYIYPNLFRIFVERNAAFSHEPKSGRMGA